MSEYWKAGLSASSKVEMLVVLMVVKKEHELAVWKVEMLVGMTAVRMDNWKVECLESKKVEK